jgi:hypothetical protein
MHGIFELFTGIYPQTLTPVNLVVETPKVFRDLTIIAETNKNFESSRVDRNCKYLAQKKSLFFVTITCNLSDIN